MNSAGSKPLPPGKSGLPILGETLPFLRDGFGFVEERRRKYGPIFRTNILGRNSAVIVGPDASGEFINSEHVQREGAMPPHIQTLFGGRCLPILDGEEHTERKRLVLAGFTAEALASYLPAMQRIVRRYAERWATGSEFRWLEEFKRLSLEVICETILSITPGPTLEQLQRDYELVGGGFSNLPIPLPGTAYTRAKNALNRILRVFAETARQRLQTPRNDGLSRILAAKSPTTGRTVSVDEVRAELHHIIVAGLIEWAWFVTAVVELERNTKLWDELREEIRKNAAEGPLTLEQLSNLPLLQRFTMEVRRLSPVVHVFFGKARQTFEFKGYTIPQGWMVLWGHRSSQLSDEIYSQPEKFDPDRFVASRAEHHRHAHAFVPNGAGPATGHKCAGYEFAPLLLEVFTVELLRGYRWEWVKPQDFGYNWAKVPPEPREGLRVRVHRLTPGLPKDPAT
jgi:cytochrome P450